MPLTRIEADNFTVFEHIGIPFNKGLNVLVGENGMGKTHIMKLAYAACRLRSMMCPFHKRLRCYSARISQASDGW